MKKTLLSLSLVLVLFSSCLSKLAQSSVADPNDKFLFLKKNYSSDVISKLKSTKTVFFLTNPDKSQQDSLKEAITSGWDLTPLEFDNIDHFDKYASNPDYSYFAIEGVTTATTSQSGGSYSNTHYYLTLRLFKDVTKKGKINTTGLCRIELFPNMETIGAGRGKSDDVISKLYNDGLFYNWSPVLLKAQLAAVNTSLKNNKRPWLFEEIKADNLSQLLAKETLYVPKSLLIDFNGLNGKEKNKEDNVFQNYGHKYKICSDQELYDIFETQKKGRLLFEYVKSSTDKFVTIYDLKAKAIVYKKYTSVSYNLKGKDIEKIE